MILLINQIKRVKGYGWDLKVVQWKNQTTKPW